jgi:hypothetical protein
MPSRQAFTLSRRIVLLHLLALLQELENLDARLMSLCIDVITALFSGHRLIFLPVYTQHLAEIASFSYHEKCVEHDRTMALYLMVDVLEFCGDEGIDTRTGAPYANEYGPLLVNAIMADKPARRQAALYGVGEFVVNCPSLSTPHLKDILEGLFFAADNPVGEEFSTVEDNAVTALGKVIMAVYNNPAYTLPADLQSREEAMNRFLVHLPLTSDHEEAKVSVHMLCTLLQNRDPDVFGGVEGVNVAKLTHCLHVFGAALQDRNVATEFLQGRIAETLSSLRGSISQSVLSEVWATLTEADRATLASSLGA